MANLEEKQIAKEILLKLIDKSGLSYDAYPGANDFVSLTLAAYKDILKTISETE